MHSLIFLSHSSHLKASSTSLVLSLTSLKSQKCISSTYKQHAKPDRLKRWVVIAKLDYFSSLLCNVYEQGTALERRKAKVQLFVYFLGGENMPRVQLLQPWACEELPEGGQTDRPAASHHSVWPLWLCPRPGALPVPQQPAEVHWDLCPEGEWPEEEEWGLYREILCARRHLDRER